MRISILLEQRFFHTEDGAVYANAQATYRHWRRFLSVFEEVQVIGRSEPVASPPPGYQRLDGPGVSFAAVPPYQGPLGLLRRAPEVLRLLRRALAGPGAVTVQLSGLLGHLGAGLCQVQGRPFGVMVVNDPFLGYAPDGSRDPLRPLVRRVLTGLTRAQCRRAAAVQYVTRRALQQRYPARPGTPTFGVSDIHLPAEAFVARPREHRGLARRALLVGNLHQRHKGMDLALRALAALRQGGLDVRLAVVGEGRLRPELEALARDLGVEGACTFLGARGTPEEVRTDLREADLFLIPSRTEGLPRTLLEAMAQGLPAVGSRVGGIPELLGPEMLVPPGDAPALADGWRSLATDPAALDRESARNLAVARDYADDRLDARREAFLGALRAASGKRPRR